MFAKLAQISLHGVGSARQVWATGEHRTGNRAACSSPIANSHRVRTPLLVCHWQQAPATGALECVWQSVPAPATDELPPERLRGQLRRLTDALAAARRPFRRAAA
jgi:hypothetical protein